MSYFYNFVFNFLKINILALFYSLLPSPLFISTDVFYFDPGTFKVFVCYFPKFVSVDFVIWAFVLRNQEPAITGVVPYFIHRHSDLLSGIPPSSGSW